MARRSLREYSKLDNDDAGNMKNREEDEDTSDTPDGQHIEENLGLDDHNLHAASNFQSLFVDYYNLFAQWRYLSIVLVLFLAVGCAFVIQKNVLNNDEQYEPEDRILKLLIPMSKKLISQQKNTWYQILTGLTNLIRPPISPAVYLLLSDENSKMASSCVAEIITTVANKILPSNEKWLFVNGSELSRAKSTDPGVLVESVSEKMHFSKVVVVSDIQKIPGNLAAGFHFLVDQENPKVRDAVYVFTMTIDSLRSVKKPLDSVEKILYKSWSNLSANILHPLVTRVTEAVLHIVQEKEIGECRLKTRATHEIRIP